MDYNSVDTAMDEVYRMHPSKAQFTRHGDTLKHFRVRAQLAPSNRFHFQAFTTPYTGTRQSDMATAAADDAEFPTARDIAYTKLSYAYTDMSMFRLSLKLSDIAEERTKDPRHAVYKLAKKMIREAELDAAMKVNTALHMDTACKMADVAAIYAYDGATYSSARYAFVQIKNGSIARFAKGQVLDIGGESDVTVLDVIYSKHGPWADGVGSTTVGTRVADIGPGVVLDYGSGLTADSSVDDDITLSGEGASDNFAGFAGWFNPTTDVYNDEDGSAITRDEKGNAWQIPEIITGGSSGSEETIDLDDHFAELADILVYRVKTGRQARVDVEDGLNFRSGFLGIADAAIINEMTRDAADSQRFTHTSKMSLSAAERTALFGVHGFEGMVYHSATLPPIALQVDVSADPHQILLLDPNSWFMLTLGTGMQGIEWLRQNGSRFHRVLGSNNLLTLNTQAGAWTAGLLACDQPGANVKIEYVKSSLE